MTTRRALPARRPPRRLLAAALCAAAFCSAARAAPPPGAASPPAPKRNIAGPGDYALREKLVKTLSRDPEIAKAPIVLILVNGGAVFSGEAGSCALKLRALRTAAAMRGIINVTDEMRVTAGDAGDGDLRKAVQARLNEAAEPLGLKEADVSVEDGVALLEGVVRDFQARVRAEDLAASVPGVTRVVTRLRPADAPAAAGPGDGALARAVQAYLRDGRNFGVPAEIEVAARDGVVTLEGRTSLVLGRQLASNLASVVGGVTRVDNRVRVDPSLPPAPPQITMRKTE